jgi:hypothetical protein
MALGGDDLSADPETGAAERRSLLGKYGLNSVTIRQGARNRTSPPRIQTAQRAKNFLLFQILN